MSRTIWCIGAAFIVATVGWNHWQPARAVDDAANDKTANAAKKPAFDKRQIDFKKGMNAPSAPGDKSQPPTAKLARRASTRDPAPVVAAIDRHWSAALTAAGVPTSPAADDAEFLRRVCLDITGRIPTYERAVTFLASDDPQKRSQLVDDLLASREYGQHFGDVWRNLIKPRDTTSSKQSADRFGPWLADQFNANRAWSDLVAEMLTTESSLSRDPQASFLVANSEEFIPKPALLAAATGRLFLGVQVGCAECHNHPFAEWKQTDFWGLAAFFARVRKVSKGDFSLTEAASDGTPSLGNTLKLADNASIVIPEGAGKGVGQIVPARFFDGTRPELSAAGPWRPALAAWITARDNPYFARAFVNRLWAKFFGRGLVHPVDDLRAENRPSHPDLLDELAREFAASDFDVQHLIRCLAGSQAYQRTSQPLPENESDAKLLSHMTVKVMSPEVLHDSLLVVVNAHPEDGGAAAVVVTGKKTIMKHTPVMLDTRENFVRLFGASADADKGEQFSYGIPQWLRYMNGEQFNGGAPFIGAMLAGGDQPEQIVETLHLVALSRRPTEAESQRMLAFVGDQKDSKQTYAGVLWILLNSSEFVVNR